MLLSQLNLGFVAFFAAELALNAFARWYHPFVANPWNLFDATIVIMYIALIAVPNDSDSLLTSLQAAGVLRILGRVRVLRKVFAPRHAFAVV